LLNLWSGGELGEVGGGNLLALSRSRLAAKRPPAEAEGRLLRSASLKVTPGPGNLADRLPCGPQFHPNG